MIHFFIVYFSNMTVSMRTTDNADEGMLLDYSLHYQHVRYLTGRLLRYAFCKTNVCL